ncbi:MAG: hypothetical protein KDI09_02545 [Halioglobus sp.]|nr:hypothetical protein [Halioglobus sp.]
MRDELATRRYLQRHIEPDLPRCGGPEDHWQQVVVVPAYRESAGLITKLSQRAPFQGGKTLVVLVINRPESDTTPSANSALRAALQALPHASAHSSACDIRRAGELTDIVVYDLEQRRGPSPAKEGVGLARKAGCDLALLWMHEGRIDSNWICNSDADASLPASYFTQLNRAAHDAVAATYPFWHRATNEPGVHIATALYELRLQHYLSGLEYAHSPYAWHSLGSCLAVRASAYAHARGFPRRAAAEDFYLLNKLGKLGPVASLQGSCIELEARTSDRVPFGTGPAVDTLAQAADPIGVPLFEHPLTFEALRVLLLAVPELADNSAQDLPLLLSLRGLPGPAAAAAARTLRDLGITAALAHCQRQSSDPATFQRHFHQWFDAFRTLKFLRGLSRAGWPLVTLGELPQLQPRLWHSPDSTDLCEMRAALAARRGWDCKHISRHLNADVD